MANKKKKYFKQYSNAKQKRSYLKAITIAVFALLFIAAVVAAVFGWLRVKDYEMKLEQLTLLMQGREEESPGPTKKTVCERLAAPETVAAYSVVQEDTYTELPAGVRHIEVGDDLSGALLYIDYPNLGVPTMGEYLSTSANYRIGRQNMQAQPFGYAKYPASSTDFFSVYMNDSFTGTSMAAAIFDSREWKDKPITSYELPADFGQVTSVNTTNVEHSALYIMDPDYVPEIPQGTVTSECPYEGCGFECGAELEDKTLYSGGYLAINVTAIKPLLVGTTETNIMFVTSQNKISIGGGALKYMYLISSSEYKTVNICDSSTVSDYVYVRIDINRANTFSAEYTNRDTMRYLKPSNPHGHITTITECPVEGCTPECAIPLKDNAGYGEGYLVINTAAYTEYATSHSDIIFGTSTGNYTCFKIVDGVLRYYDRLVSEGTTFSVNAVAYDGKGESEYVYVYMPSGMGVYNLSADTAFKNTFVGYLSATPEFVTVTVERASGSETHRIHKGAALSIEHTEGASANYGWYNADGCSLSEITKDTTFTETYSFSYGHIPVTLYKPYSYNAETVIKIEGKGEEVSKTSVPYIQGYAGESGTLYLLYDTDAFKSVIDTYIGSEARNSYDKITVEVITTKISEAERGEYRTASRLLSNMYFGGKAVESKYSVLDVTGEGADISLKDSIVIFNIEIEAGKLPEEPEREGYDFVGWFYGSDDDHSTAVPCRQYAGEPISFDAEFHAHFAIKQFKVIYNTGGAGTVEPATVNWNESAPIPDVTRTGYNLIGWYLDDGTEYTGQAVTQDIVLTAEWAVKILTVTFYVGDKVYKTMTVEYGTELTKVSEAAAISEEDIVSARYINGQSDDIEISEMLVTDDMYVQLLEPSKMDNVMSAIKKYWLPVVIAVAVVFAIAVVAAVIVTNKKNKSGNTRKRR